MSLLRMIVVYTFPPYIHLSGNSRVGSEQTDPRKALPTPSSCLMGFRITPSNASELVREKFQFLLIFMRTYEPTFAYCSNDKHQNKPNEPNWKE